MDDAVAAAWAVVGRPVLEQPRSRRDDPRGRFRKVRRGRRFRSASSTVIDRLPADRSSPRPAKLLEHLGRRRDDAAGPAVEEDRHPPLHRQPDVLDEVRPADNSTTRTGPCGATPPPRGPPTGTARARSVGRGRLEGRSPGHVRLRSGRPVRRRHSRRRRSRRRRGARPPSGPRSRVMARNFAWRWSLWASSDSGLQVERLDDARGFPTVGAGQRPRSS